MQHLQHLQQLQSRPYKHKIEVSVIVGDTQAFVAPTDVDVNAGTVWLGDTREAILKPIMTPMPAQITIVHRPYLSEMSLMEAERLQAMGALRGPDRRDSHSALTRRRDREQDQSYSQQQQQQQQQQQRASSLAPRPTFPKHSLNRVTVQLPIINLRVDADQFAILVDVIKTVLSTPLPKHVTSEDDDIDDDGVTNNNLGCRFPSSIASHPSSISATGASSSSTSSSSFFSTSTHSGTGVGMDTHGVLYGAKDVRQLHHERMQLEWETRLVEFLLAGLRTRDYWDHERASSPASTSASASASTSASASVGASVSSPASSYPGSTAAMCLQAFGLAPSRELSGTGTGTGTGTGEDSGDGNDSEFPSMATTSDRPYGRIRGRQRSYRRLYDIDSKEYGWTGVGGDSIFASSAPVGTATTTGTGGSATDQRLAQLEAALLTGGGYGFGDSGVGSNAGFAENASGKFIRP